MIETGKEERIGIRGTTAMPNPPHFSNNLSITCLKPLRLEKTMCGYVSASFRSIDFLLGVEYKKPFTKFGIQQEQLVWKID